MRLRNSLYKVLGLICILMVLIIILVNNFTKYPTAGIKTETYNQNLTLMQNVTTVLSNRNLLNLSDFYYLLEPDFCKQPPKEILGLILITSYAGHDEVRAAHRQAITATKLKALNMQRVFLLAVIPSRDHFITQSQLSHEHECFGDLLQGNFIEAYRNLSYKHVMGLQWATTIISKCIKAKFIIKLDDDIVYDIFYIKHYLEVMAKLEENTNKQTNDYIAGYVLHGKATIRNQASKWYVTPEEYSKDIYPDYLSGWLYIIKPQTATKLIEQAYRQSSIFWIDDLWLTGLIRNDLNISLTTLNAWFSENSQFLECCVRDLKLNRNLQCDYYVGPNGGDHKLIIEFIDNIKKCYYNNSCIIRSRQEDYLRNTCVTSYHKRLPDHGVGIINRINLKR